MSRISTHIKVKQLVLFTIAIVMNLSWTGTGLGVSARKTYTIKEEFTSQIKNGTKIPLVRAMSDFTTEWCSNTRDANDFFCIWTNAEIKEYLTNEQAFTDRTDFTEHWFPFLYWHLQLDFFWRYVTAWEYEWKVVRFWDQIFRYHVPSFDVGAQLDVVFHFEPENIAVCLHPGMYITPVNFKIEQEMQLLNCETEIIKGLDYLKPDSFFGLGPNILDSCSLSTAS